MPYLTFIDCSLQVILLILIYKVFIVRSQTKPKFLVLIARRSLERRMARVE